MIVLFIFESDPKVFVQAGSSESVGIKARSPCLFFSVESRNDNKVNAQLNLIKSKNDKNEKTCQVFILVKALHTFILFITIFFPSFSSS